MKSTYCQCLSQFMAKVEQEPASINKDNPPGYPNQRDIESAFTLMACILLGGVLLAVVVVFLK